MAPDLILEDSERAKEMGRLLACHVKDRYAIDFLNNVFWAYSWFDDLIDGDATIGHGSALDMFDVLMYRLPSNPFFLAHGNLILPATRVAMENYETATRIEWESRLAQCSGLLDKSDSSLLYRRLRSSFELRNSPFNLAPLCVDILHGKKARDDFAVQWATVSRDFELFDDYVEKVTASSRPMKPDQGDADGMV